MPNQPPLRCALLAVGDFPEGGATSQRLYFMAKIFSEGLGQASLWILHPTAKVALAENSAVQGRWQDVEFRYLNGAVVRPSTAWGALTDTLKGLYRCLRLLAGDRATRPDVLVVYTPSFLKFIVPMLLARSLGIPVIVEACEIRSYLLEVSDLGLIRRLANSGETLMERLIPKLAHGLLPISQRIDSFYAHVGTADGAAYLLPVLIDADYYQATAGQPVGPLVGQRFLLNSGSFSEKDGIPFLIKALVKVHDQHPDLKLVFTGSAPPEIRDNILQMAGNDAEQWIVFTGFLSREELIWCYKHAAGLLSCRSNSSFANYGFPTKLAEYLASGTPVVATRVGDTEQYLADGDNAYLATAEDSDSIAAAMVRLLSDPQAAAQIGMRGVEVARRYFDYRNHIGGVADFIRRVTA